uniref:Nucleoporin NUP188 n=1 Tax=Davidia involucrata TaxID=16924 RepID=A0A5B6ZZV4_DAVIN
MQTIQVGAARVLSMLFVIADYSQPYVLGNACFGLDDKQITDFRHSVKSILCEQSQWNKDLFAATFKLLTSAALYQPAFLVAVIAARENTNVQLSNDDGVKQPNEAAFGLIWSKEVNLIDALLQYVGRSEDLIKSNPHMLLNVLNCLKALWQGPGQFTNILDRLKSSEKFWRLMSSSILLIASMQDNPSDNLIDTEIVSLAYRYQCQSAVLQIMAYEMFLQKKLLHSESLVKQTSESSKNRIEKADSTEKTKDAGLGGLKDILSTWCENSVLGNLIKSYASCEYDNDMYLRAKTAAGLFAVHVMRKLESGDTGSLSVSLIKEINILSKKLSDLPAFFELLAQYTQHGYSDGKELKSLILSDLYYHLQGELEGRKIDAGPFKELSQYLLDSKFLQTYRRKYDGNLFAQAKDVYLFDSTRLRADLGSDMWDYSEWRTSKEVAETLLLCLQDANSMVLLASSKLSALKALITFLSLYKEDSTEKETAVGKIPEQLILSCIDHICHCLQITIESLAPILDDSEDLLDFLAAQAELLLHLIRSVHKRLSLCSCVLVLRTSGSGLKVLSGFRSSVTGVGATMKLLLMLLLSSVKLSCTNSLQGGARDKESVEAFAEVSNASLGLLPILCDCIEPAEYCILSLTIIDLILKSFLTPNTWFPIIQKYLQLQPVVQKLQNKNYLASIPMILKFLLTLAHVKGGAEMLLTAGFFPTLRVFFADLSDGEPFSVIQSESNLFSDKVEKPQHVWGLSLAVVTAMIHSLGDSSSCTDIVDYVITYFFSEKAYLISYYLSAPDFPSDGRDKKRARAQKTQTSLSAFKETEHTLMLLCVLAKHRNSWIKAMKEMDSQLRERSIHLLAFISRGTQKLGESPSRVAPLLCHPMLKEEFEWYKKSSFINSRNGWFALSPLCCGLDPKFSAVSSRTTSLVIKDQAYANTGPAPQTFFSDTMAIQIYRLAFLLLKFLCLQAEGAARRAEDVGFVDLAHFPELPMPDILHGLQDQAIAIVTELCEANKLKPVPSEIQGVCILLLQITDMALYLEFCVSQICGIRPVLGRVEDFSKELKLLMRGMEGHAFFKVSLKSLKQIISFVYPGLLQTEGFL